MVLRLRRKIPLQGQWKSSHDLFMDDVLMAAMIEKWTNFRCRKQRRKNLRKEFLVFFIELLVFFIELTCVYIQEG